MHTQICLLGKKKKEKKSFIPPGCNDSLTTVEGSPIKQNQQNWTVKMHLLIIIIIINGAIQLMESLILKNVEIVTKAAKGSGDRA